jgi:hypothetical protein
MDCACIRRAYVPRRMLYYLLADFWLAGSRTLTLTLTLAGVHWRCGPWVRGHTRRLLRRHQRQGRALRGLTPTLALTLTLTLTLAPTLALAPTPALTLAPTLALAPTPALTLKVELCAAELPASGSNAADTSVPPPCDYVAYNDAKERLSPLFLALALTLTLTLPRTLTPTLALKVELCAA